MPHADSALLPAHVDSKPALWAHVHDQLAALLADQRAWPTNLANAASLIFHSLAAFAPAFGEGERAVNWAGFYIDPAFFPTPTLSSSSSHTLPNPPQILLLGPFHGRPACQHIALTKLNARPLGVCASAFLSRATVLIPDVHAFPGHIACDDDTNSEIVVPLVLPRRSGGRDREGGESGEGGEGEGEGRCIGVLDLDSVGLATFDDDDRAGLERIAALVVAACDW